MEYEDTVNLCAQDIRATRKKCLTSSVRTLREIAIQKQYRSAEDVVYLLFGTFAQLIA